MGIKTILIGLGAAIVTGGAILGGGNAIKDEVEGRKAADAFEKRSKERYPGYDISVRERKFGGPKIKIKKVTLDGNYKVVNDGGDGK